MPTLSDIYTIVTLAKTDIIMGHAVITYISMLTHQECIKAVVNPSII